MERIAAFSQIAHKAANSSHALGQMPETVCGYVRHEEIRLQKPGGLAFAQKSGKGLSAS